MSKKVRFTEELNTTHEAPDSEAFGDAQSSVAAGAVVGNCTMTQGGGLDGVGSPGAGSSTPMHYVRRATGRQSPRRNAGSHI